MPVIDLDRKPFANADRRAVGIWMGVEGTKPPQFVAVFVRYTTLELAAPSKPPGIDSVFDTFNQYWPNIVAAANARYQEQLFEDDKYDGQPVIVVRQSDL